MTGKKRSPAYLQAKLKSYFAELGVVTYAPLPAAVVHPPEGPPVAVLVGEPPPAFHPIPLATGISDHWACRIGCSFDLKSSGAVWWPDTLALDMISDETKAATPLPPEDWCFIALVIQYLHELSHAFVGWGEAHVFAVEISVLWHLRFPDVYHRYRLAVSENQGLSYYARQAAREDLEDAGLLRGNRLTGYTLQDVVRAQHCRRMLERRRGAAVGAAIGLALGSGVGL